ncbi:MAG: hypothetical protein M1815_002118 [Lichina confinis]|nr:MAG: hypothetical protein M1815_002118 [Lichina confinis]
MVDLLVSEEGKRGYAVRGWRSRVLGPGRAGWERTRGQRREPLYSEDLVGKSFPHPRNCSDIRHWSTETYEHRVKESPPRATSSAIHLTRRVAAALNGLDSYGVDEKRGRRMMAAPNRSSVGAACSLASRVRCQSCAPVRARIAPPLRLPSSCGTLTSRAASGPIPSAKRHWRSSPWMVPGTLALGVIAGAAGAWHWCGPDLELRRTGPSADGLPKYGTAKKMQQVCARMICSNLHLRKKASFSFGRECKAVAEIRRTVSDTTVSTDDEDLHAHGYSEWSTVNSDRLPIAVAYPRSTEDVSQIAKICHKYRVPMIPYSGGSSLEGNFSAPYGGMSVDFAYMDKVVQFHDADMDIVVQPAVSWMELNDKLTESGLFFPVDPGPSAKIGGMVGTNCRYCEAVIRAVLLAAPPAAAALCMSKFLNWCWSKNQSGTNAVRYGTMKDWVLNLTVVLADGRVIKTRQRPRKSSAGYNLTALFVGSEGTLGIVTEITLKLAVVPQETSVAVVTFPSVRAAASAASQVIRAGVPVGAVELMDEVAMQVVNRSGTTSRKWKEVPTLFFKFSGTIAGVEESTGLVEAIAKRHGAGDFEFARDARERQTLWSARKELFWSTLALRTKNSDVWSTDVAVPLSRLSDIIEISKREMDELGLFASILGHVGDGNFHESILYDTTDQDEKERGEHGIGLGKKPYLVKELGLDTIGVMQSIKGALDPYWLMNPGKIIDAPTTRRAYSVPRRSSTLEAITGKGLYDGGCDSVTITLSESR